MYHVSAQGVDECMINIHYYYYNLFILFFDFMYIHTRWYPFHFYPLHLRTLRPDDGFFARGLGSCVWWANKLRRIAPNPDLSNSTYVPALLPHVRDVNSFRNSCCWLVFIFRLGQSLIWPTMQRPWRQTLDTDWTPHSTTLSASISKFSKLASIVADVRVQELCESRGGRPGLPVLMSLKVSVDAKQHWTMLRHWSQFVPNMSTDIRGH